MYMSQEFQLASSVDVIEFAYDFCGKNFMHTISSDYALTLFMFQGNIQKSIFIESVDDFDL